MAMGWIRDPVAAMATPMTPGRFQDRWEVFKGEPQQVSGIWGLYRSIAELEGSGDILDEHAGWARKFSEKPSAPPAPPTPAPPSGGLDPRGSEEACMVGPKLKAPVKPGDSYPGHGPEAHWWKQARGPAGRATAEASLSSRPTQRAEPEAYPLLVGSPWTGQ